MRYSRTESYKRLGWIFVVFFLVGIFISCYSNKTRDKNDLKRIFNDLCTLTIDRNWNLMESHIKMYGYNIWQSEHTCLQRSLPDVRAKNCGTVKPAGLPQVSIVMTFNYVDVSVVLRALESISKRTPPELLHEVIVVDDASERIEFTSHDFRKYLHDMFGSKFQLHRSETLLGSWPARLLGAQMARGEVLVFVEPFVEVNVNWLPPLLAPIQANANVSTVPLLDVIHFTNMSYTSGKPQRLAFNWKLEKLQLPLPPEQAPNPITPYDMPLLSAEVLAIDRKRFWRLGAYQTEFFNPMAVQLELTFKLWLCGGQLLQVPCSRVGYLQRRPNTLSRESLELELGSYMDKYMSFKNVLEVWFDEYQPHIYEQGNFMKSLRPHHLRTQLAMRRRLQCKPASYFFRYVAPEIEALDPIELPKEYAQGEIRMLNEPTMCLSLVKLKNMSMSLHLLECKMNDRGLIDVSQLWALDSLRNLHQGNICLELRSDVDNTNVKLRHCHYGSEQKVWYYNFDKQRLELAWLGHRRRCVEARVLEQRVVIADCIEGEPRQQWTFKVVDKEGLAQSMENQLRLVQQFELN